jgi:hypothetical protein
MQTKMLIGGEFGAGEGPARTGHGESFARAVRMAA